MEYKNRVPSPSPKAIAAKRRELIASIFLGIVIVSAVGLTVVLFRYFH